MSEHSSVHWIAEDTVDDEGLKKKKKGRFWIRKAKWTRQKVKENPLCTLLVTVDTIVLDNSTWERLLDTLWSLHHPRDSHGCTSGVIVAFSSGGVNKFG